MGARYTAEQPRRGGRSDRESSPLFQPPWRLHPPPRTTLDVRPPHPSSFPTPAASVFTFSGDVRRRPPSNRRTPLCGPPASYTHRGRGRPPSSITSWHVLPGGGRATLETPPPPPPPGEPRRRRRRSRRPHENEGASFPSGWLLSPPRSGPNGGAAPRLPARRSPRCRAVRRRRRRGGGGVRRRPRGVSKRPRFR